MGYRVHHDNIANPLIPTRSAIINGGSHQCEFHPRGAGSPQCLNRNGLFQIDITAYRQLQRYPAGGVPPVPAYAALQIAALRATGHIIGPHNGIKTFCWTHANRITGLRVIDVPGRGKGLVTTRAFHNHEEMATFAMTNRTQAQLNTAYDGIAPYVSNTVPYGLSNHPAGGARRVYDDWAFRGFADYSNDIRGNVGVIRTRPTCHGANGLRNLNCWTLTAADGDIAANVVETFRRFGAGPASDKNILESRQAIAAGTEIRWNYGRQYWRDSFCPTAANPSRLCNRISR
jgi:hypothetical protein